MRNAKAQFILNFIFQRRSVFSDHKTNKNINAHSTIKMQILVKLLGNNIPQFWKSQ